MGHRLCKILSFVLFFSLIIESVLTFRDESCPPPALFMLVAEEMCGKVEDYHCLYNGTSRMYKRYCFKARPFPAGSFVLYEGGLDAKACPTDRYQPIGYLSNQFNSECMYSKTRCSDEGQVVYDSSHTEKDRTCRCDYTQGYDFVTKPRNRCFCNPTAEDCSCFKRQCPENTTLSPDYKCKDTVELITCPGINHSKDKSKDSGIILIVNDAWSTHNEFKSAFQKWIPGSVVAVIIIVLLIGIPFITECVVLSLFRKEADETLGMARRNSLDKEGHAKAIKVVVIFYPEMMREMIIKSFPPETNASQLKNIIKDDNHPLTKTLTDNEKEILGKFDAEGYSECDLSLLYKLIRYLGLIESPTNKWGCEPSPGDLKHGDDIERMKRFGDEVLYRPIGSLTKSEKDYFFQESEKIASRVDELIGCSFKGFEYKIRELKTDQVTKETQNLQNGNHLEEVKELLKITNKLHVELYYGKDIAAKLDLNKDGDSNGETSCTLYIRDPDMDIAKILKKINKLNKKLKKGNLNIKFRRAEKKCLAIHIDINNMCFSSKEHLHRAIETFLQKLFKLTSLDKKLKSHVDVVLAKSDNIFDIDDTEDSNEYFNFLKLDVSVQDTAFQTDAHLYQHVNKFCKKIYHFNKLERPTNGSPIEVVIAVEEKQSSSSHLSTTEQTFITPFETDTSIQGDNNEGGSYNTVSETSDEDIRIVIPVQSLSQIGDDADNKFEDSDTSSSLIVCEDCKVPKRNIGRKFIPKKEMSYPLSMPIISLKE